MGEWYEYGWLLNCRAAGCAEHRDLKTVLGRLPLAGGPRSSAVALAGGGMEGGGKPKSAKAAAGDEEVINSLAKTAEKLEKAA